MYAIVKTGGKQYCVEVGKKISVEKLDIEVGSEVTLDEVLFIGGDKVEIELSSSSGTSPAVHIAGSHCD